MNNLETNINKNEHRPEQSEKKLNDTHESNESLRGTKKETLGTLQRITQGTHDRIAKLLHGIETSYGYVVMSASEKMDPFFISDELEEAKQMRGTSLDEYSKVHKDVDPEFVEDEDLDDQITCRHFEAQGKGSGTLYVYMLGNKQQPDSKEGVGCLDAYRKACGNGCDAIILSPGRELARVRGDAEHQTDVMYEHALNQIESKIDPERHKRIAFCCFSWGGGMFLRSIKGDKNKKRELDERLKGVKVSQVTLVDPVNLGTLNFGIPARDIPEFPCKKMTYIYQGADSIGERLNPLKIVHNKPKSPPPNMKVIKIEDVTHGTIDSIAYERGLLPVGPQSMWKRFTALFSRT